MPRVMKWGRSLKMKERARLFASLKKKSKHCFDWFVIRKKYCFSWKKNKLKKTNYKRNEQPIHRQRHLFHWVLAFNCSRDIEIKQLTNFNVLRPRIMLLGLWPRPIKIWWKEINYWLGWCSRLSQSVWTLKMRYRAQQLFRFEEPSRCCLFCSVYSVRLVLKSADKLAKAVLLWEKNIVDFSW